MEGPKVVLEVEDLVTSFQTEIGKFNALDKVSFKVHEGETLGIVGESGCGKSVTSLSILRLLPKPAGKIESGRVVLHHDDRKTELQNLPIRDLHKMRGRNIGMIFQEPMTALNPVHRVSRQIIEVFNLHFPDMTKKDCEDAALELFEKVGIPAPRKRLSDYPHQLSGGMRQRVMIAMALAGKPKVLIADEPTTALDVTTQAQILRLFKELQEEYKMSLILITHDMGVVAQVCDSVAVMYAGRVIEKGDASAMFAAPLHPYTMGLLDSIPSLGTTPKTKLKTIEGLVPSLQEMPESCRFANRCPYVENACRADRPAFQKFESKHEVACTRISELHKN